MLPDVYALLFVCFIVAQLFACATKGGEHKDKYRRHPRQQLPKFRDQQSAIIILLQ